MSAEVRTCLNDEENLLIVEQAQHRMLGFLRASPLIPLEGFLRKVFTFPFCRWSVLFTPCIYRRSFGQFVLLPVEKVGDALMCH